jgi:hypothetical protein
MDVFSTELGIRLSFVKTLEFQREGGRFEPPPPPYTTELRSTNLLMYHFMKPVNRLQLI